MEREQILDLYDWSAGICFRHPAAGVVPTAHVSTVRPAAGGIQDIRACAECVMSMERQRERTAASEGRTYKFGELGGD